MIRVRLGRLRRLCGGSQFTAGTNYGVVSTSDSGMVYRVRVASRVLGTRNSIVNNTVFALTSLTFTISSGLGKIPSITVRDGVHFCSSAGNAGLVTAYGASGSKEGLNRCAIRVVSSLNGGVTKCATITFRGGWMARGGFTTLRRYCCVECMGSLASGSEVEKQMG